MQSRIFLHPKEKWIVTFVDFGKSVGPLGKAIPFSPLFRLYFIRRIYEYGDKVKLLLGYAELGKIWWILTKWRKQFGGKYNPLCLSTCITKNIVIREVIFSAEKHIEYTFILK